MKQRMLFCACLISVLLGCSSPAIRESGQSAGNTPGNVQVIVPVVAAKTAVPTPLIDGPGIAALFNKNYNEDSSSCIEYGTGKVRGYYWCTGVLLRTVDNGDFNPWEPSTNALTLKGISFSWIRHDVGTNTLYHPAGFIVLSPADVIGGQVPGTVGSDITSCVYPFDAWTTRTMTRRYGGCDDEGSGLGFPDNITAWGSCDQLYGYTTSAQWDTHFRDAKEVNYKQCSWNADNPQGWRNMIASRKNFSGQYSWNEVMLKVRSAAVGEDLRKWATAFFYDPRKAAGLGDAQAFQRKLAATGRAIPILRLVFTAPAASRFQYVAVDQVAYP